MGKEEYVVMGARLECALGATPSVLMVPVTKGFTIKNKIVATQVDMVPLMNVMPFGVCKISSPPLPCIPTPVGPWMKPHSKVTACNIPVLTTSSCLMCARGGKISIKSSGQ
ncbi:DUF4280 domain-containing protein [Anaeromicropila populeti]|uniref:DUF4280 domain-containing protein n=1 Tax=Anaeromicropila populeti TaxID=37658 RepID=A0A1I6IAX1_9FIRM|nr:DUF4280 domain-containing protein [Anaeromicropila populeti]SFR63897.1 protein of unknown function [Anaeromicropila populeti]